MQPMYSQKCVILDVDDTLFYENIQRGCTFSKNTYTAIGLAAADQRERTSLDKAKPFPKFDKSFLPLGRETYPDDPPIDRMVAFIASAQFTKLFETVNKINEEKGQDAISLRILTSNVYTKKTLVDALKTKYPAFCKVCERASFEFYNKKDIVGGEDGWHGVSLRSEPYSILKDGKYYNCSKAILMNAQFTNWQSKQPNLIKENCFLVDDDATTCEMVIEHGYKAVHLPTRKEKEEIDNPEIVSIEKRIEDLIAILET